jgi:DNA-binding NarL/FixJ family response regulator
VDGEDACRQARALAPDVVLMDLNMPNVNGVEATERLVEEFPALRVVALSTYDDDAWVYPALRAGARGYLTKDASADDIEAAIRTVLKGQAQLDPGIQLRLLRSLDARPGTGPAAAGGPEAAEDTDGTAAAAGRLLERGLTAREIDVLSLVAQGRSNAEIAAELYVGDATVKTHINRLLSKSGSRDRAQLVIFAFRHGLGHPPQG